MFLSIFAVSCEKDEVTTEDSVVNETNLQSKSFAEIDYDIAFNNVIGFTDADTNEFHQLTPHQLVNYWRTALDIEAAMEFTDFTIEETDSRAFFLRTISTNGEQNIKINLTYKGGGIFEIGGKTCSCKSKACASSPGCQSMANDDGSNCYCSSCSLPFGATRDCEKNSSTTSEYTFNQFL
ncbi:hypothetical protein [Paenimyroides aestuarii]|uniref:Uncharacterized protein n=1 Tax=Paenimyroides aestuarii TaxID=2968490 RepID=A0ABY5NUG3_9FLAO|nr:hypothetical protein [Paenimyroides aestuarii]UUV22235.1 hypothetical protein NPX36_04145 [Paenimyroides aestuarii]